MGKRLKEKDIHPQLILTSPAKRTLSTAKRIAKVIGYNKENIKKNEKLYHADEETMLTAIQSLKDKYDTVMVVGHNPGLTDFVNTLRDDEMDIDNVPTCGVVAFTIAVDSWKEVKWGSAKVIFFDYPKSQQD
jgi:phosphohistidine phosphatase